MLAFAAVIGLAVAGAPFPAFAADGKSLNLAWDAPPECPSRIQVQTDVARLLGGTIPMPQGGALDAQAKVEHGQVWSVAITTQHAGQTGRRTIQSGSCQEVADATALIIALMIDPDAVAAHAQDPKVDQPPTAAPSPENATPPSPALEARPGGLLATIHAQGSLGTLPGLDVGAGVGLGLAGRRWRIELRGTYGLRRDQVAHASAPPGAYGQFNFTGGAFSGCFNLGHDAVDFGPCADAELGVVSAKGFGVSVGFPAHTTWVALGAGGYVAIALGSHVNIPIHIDVLAPLLRPEYVFKDVEGRVYQAPPVGARIHAGVAWRF
jgi:hypothetical protein